jgi:regulatory protein
MTAAELHEAALAYLSRRPATVAMMTRVLRRKVMKKGVDLDDAADVIHSVVARLVTAGLVNDTTFAETRSRRLSREGRSSRAIAAHLAQKGVRTEVARSVINRDGDLDAALVLTKKRRIGAFRREELVDNVAKQRELGVLARAGFDRSTAERALRFDREEAEERLGTRGSLF